MSRDAQVLIVGAGPAGLTLACDLLRRGVDVRIVDAAETGFAGSRAKGIQPRTLEVFDDLGVLEDLTMRSSNYPPLGIHIGPAVIPFVMQRRRRPTDDIPYPNTLMVAQSDTDACLRRRLRALGGEVEYGTAFTGCSSVGDGVAADLSRRDGGQEVVSARYLVGADGGSSTVRKQLGIAFVGETDEADRIIVADVTIKGLSRRRWHIWPRTRMALCPLPGGDRFQLMVRLRAGEQPDLSPAAIAEQARKRSGRAAVRIDEVTWSSLFRPNVRLADHYRKSNAFLLGDAAHVHTPAGAQGLNTGVQDAYNLGWKLAQVLAGAPAELLDTYEVERRPIAAQVLGFSSELYSNIERKPLAAARRGDRERQLSITYRGGPLSYGTEGTLRAGDRAPDATYVTADGTSSTVFEATRGPQFTLLAIGEEAWPKASETNERPAEGGAELKIVQIPSAGAKQLNATYGLAQPSSVLIRPDGYLACVAEGRWPKEMLRALTALMA